MNKLYILFLAAIVLFFSACKKVSGEGDVRTETRITEDFSGIDSSILGNLLYVQGAEHKIELTAEENKSTIGRSFQKVSCIVPLFASTLNDT